MSSTEGELESRLLALFHELIVPSAQRARARGLSLLPPGPDPSIPTYYVSREHSTLRRANFEADLEHPQALLQILRTWWTETEAAVLLPLAATIFDLAPMFETVEETGDVSPFIYVMF